MKKTLLLVGFVCLLSFHAVTRADIASHSGAICILKDDCDDMSEEELLALQNMQDIEQSVVQEWIASRAGILFGWYMSYRRCVYKLASQVKRIKRSRRA